MMPVLSHNLLQSAELLTAAADTFRERCVEGIHANEERSRWLVEQNIIVVTALVPHIGYDAAAKVAKEAFASGRGVRDVVLDTGLMEPDELDRALDLRKMTEGGIAGA
jgi:fumarate hydratase class II